MKIKCMYQLKEDGSYFQETITSNEITLIDACIDAFKQVKSANGKVFNLSGEQV